MPKTRKYYMLSHVNVTDELKHKTHLKHNKYENKKWHTVEDIIKTTIKTKELPGLTLHTTHT